jgi:hypothetical protein
MLRDDSPSQQKVIDLTSIADSELKIGAEDLARFRVHKKERLVSSKHSAEKNVAW